MSINHELRIGNSVLLNGEIQYVSRGEELDWLSYEGVPITKERLLILGFTPGGYKQDGWLEKHPIYISNYQKTCFKIGFDCSEYGIGEFTFEVEYIHQIENLYNVLTGKELSI